MTALANARKGSGEGATVGVTQVSGQSVGLQHSGQGWEWLFRTTQLLKHQFGGPNNYENKLRTRKIITVQFGVVLQVTEFSASAAVFRALGRQILPFSRIIHLEIQLKIELQGN